MPSASLNPCPVIRTIAARNYKTDESMFLFEIKRLSPGRTWEERYLVETHAATICEARAQVEFTLDSSERIAEPPRDAIRLVWARTS